MIQLPGREGQPEAIGGREACSHHETGEASRVKYQKSKRQPRAYIYRIVKVVAFDFGSDVCDQTADTLRAVEQKISPAFKLDGFNYAPERCGPLNQKSTRRRGIVSSTERLVCVAKFHLLRKASDLCSRRRAGMSWRQTNLLERGSRDLFGRRCKRLSPVAVTPYEQQCCGRDGLT